jgi:hypothetical protein
VKLGKKQSIKIPSRVDRFYLVEYVDITVGIYSDSGYVIHSAFLLYPPISAMQALWSIL